MADDAGNRYSSEPAAPVAEIYLQRYWQKAKRRLFQIRGEKVLPFFLADRHLQPDKQQIVLPASRSKSELPRVV